MELKLKKSVNKEEFLINVLKLGYSSIIRYQNNSEYFLNRLEGWIFDVLLTNEELLQIPECVEIINLALIKYYELKSIKEIA